MPYDQGLPTEEEGNMGKPKTEEHRRKISEALRGKKHTKRSKRLRSEAMTKFWSDIREMKAQAEREAQDGND